MLNISDGDFGRKKKEQGPHCPQGIWQGPHCTSNRILFIYWIFCFFKAVGCSLYLGISINPRCFGIVRIKNVALSYQSSSSLKGPWSQRVSFSWCDIDSESSWNPSWIPVHFFFFFFCLLLLENSFWRVTSRSSQPRVFCKKRCS